MGNCNCIVNCNKVENESTLLAQTEEDIQFPQYSSIIDSHLDCLEQQNNVLRCISLVEYINLLSYFSLEKATIPFQGPYKIIFSFKDEFLSNEMDEESFQSFIENIILRNREIGEEESTFKEICIELFKSLKLQLIQNSGDENKNITKRDLICLGTLFCKTTNINKIKLLFDIFKNEKELFIPSEELNEFLICSFLISSYCLINAKKNLSQINPIIPEISSEDLKTLLSFSDLKDCQNLVKLFNIKFFFNKKSFTWKEFQEKFIGINGFGWIFSTKGIRQKLQENQNETDTFLDKLFGK